ncbi:hypothetical protein EMPS_06868 [Entomortierella parvispora]|uniref:Uncharacterized protein n=1 Tax=Entomortierella parvispora TaxID=205924 RepID=A0A9P3HDG0_9FUNG|nr:hypothetical protein EMPS_06868 [Entomortierella parvispora]
MRRAPALNVEDYITFVGARFPSAKASHIAKEWDTLKEFFCGGIQERYSEVEELVNAPELIAAFNAAPTLSAETVEAIIPPRYPSLGLVCPRSSSLSSPASSSMSAPQDNSNISSSGSGSSGNGSSGSIEHLTPTQVSRMQALFKHNLDSFKGNEWQLPSGVTLDHILYETIKDVRYECPLHSFVINNAATILDLFPDIKDQEELKMILFDRAGENMPALSSAEKATLELYNKDPEELQELLAQKGWRAIGSTLDEKPSSEFQRLVHDCLLEFQPGEYHSQASMNRRNLDGSRDVRQLVGHKVDGAAVAAIKKLELLVIEAAKKDESPNVTKAQDDRLKFGKLMKDMHDLIRTKAKYNVREHLITFGIQISGESATFFTLRQRRGRFYQLCNEGTETLPSIWNDEIGTRCILGVLMKVLMLRKALISMTKDVAACTVGSLDGSTTNNEVDWFPATITSPQFIPSSSSTVNDNFQL